MWSVDISKCIARLCARATIWLGYSNGHKDSVRCRPKMPVLCLAINPLDSQRRRHQSLRKYAPGVVRIKIWGGTCTVNANHVGCALSKALVSLPRCFQASFGIDCLNHLFGVKPFKDVVLAAKPLQGVLARANGANGAKAALQALMDGFHGQGLCSGRGWLP